MKKAHKIFHFKEMIQFILNTHHTTHGRKPGMTCGFRFKEQRTFSSITLDSISCEKSLLHKLNSLTENNNNNRIDLIWGTVLL